MVELAFRPVEYALGGLLFRLVAVEAVTETDDEFWLPWMGVN